MTDNPFNAPPKPSATRVASLFGLRYHISDDPEIHISDDPEIHISPSFPHRLTLNEQRTLAFLEGSEPKLSSTGLEDLVVGGRLTKLRAINVPFLDTLLTGPYVKNLTKLDVFTRKEFPFEVGFLPPATSPASSSYPLKEFSLKVFGTEISPSLGDNLLNFLRNFQDLEVLFFKYDDPAQVVKFTSENVVSLNKLRSFTCESPVSPMPTGPFDRLVLPSTCNIALTINDIRGKSVYEPLDHSFPVLRDSSYLSDVRAVRITVRDEYEYKQCEIHQVGVTFSNSKREISFNRRAYLGPSRETSGVVKKIEDFLVDKRVHDSIKELTLDQPGERRIFLDR